MRGQSNQANRRLKGRGPRDNRPQRQDRQDRPQRKRSDHNQQRDNRPQRNQHQNNQGNRFKKRFIRKGKDGKIRINRGGKRRHDGRNERKPQNRDLDKQLINYWTKHKKGDKADGENKQQAIKVLNLEMDSYWRKKQTQQKGKAATS